MSKIHTPTSTLTTAPGAVGQLAREHQERERQAQVDDPEQRGRHAGGDVVAARQDQGRRRPPGSTLSAEAQQDAVLGVVHPPGQHDQAERAEVAGPAQRPRGGGEAVELVQARARR